jgi:AraC family transcriptional regulator
MLVSRGARFLYRSLTIRDFTDGLPMDKLRQVTEYINDNLEHDLSLDAIAATIGMSSYHFPRMFKQSIGLAPHQYVIERRLKWAQVLLTTTELTILEICFRVGFKEAGSNTPNLLSYNRYAFFSSPMCQLRITNSV